jgi:hypothetical protein
MGRQRLMSPDSGGAMGTTSISPATSATISQWAGGLAGVEERVGSPDVIDVVEAQGGVLEEVGGLVVDLEGCLVIEGIEIEQRIHDPIVLQTRTSRLPDTNGL